MPFLLSLQVDFFRSHGLVLNIYPLEVLKSQAVSSLYISRFQLDFDVQFVSFFTCVTYASACKSLIAAPYLIVGNSFGLDQSTLAGSDAGALFESIVLYTVEVPPNTLCGSTANQMYSNGVLQALMRPKYELVQHIQQPTRFSLLLKYTEDLRLDPNWTNRAHTSTGSNVGRLQLTVKSRAKNRTKS